MLTLIMVMIFGGKVFEIALNSFKGMIFLSQTMLYSMLNQMIKNFNQFANEVVKIGYEFEQDDFEYSQTDMIP